MVRPIKCQNATIFRWCDSWGFHFTIWHDWWFRFLNGCRPILFSVQRCGEYTTCERWSWRKEAKEPPAHFVQHAK